MTQRVFYVIGIADRLVRCVFNAMRLISDPNAKGETHVTVRGPYTKEVDLPEQLLGGTSLSVFGAGCFFEDQQSTVFLRCGFPEMQRVWDKRGHRDINGHLTIYDGNERDFASRLLTLLSDRKLYFTFQGTNLHILKSSRGQWTLDLRMAIDFDVINRVFSTEVDWANVHKMEPSERLIYIGLLADFLRETQVEN